MAPYRPGLLKRDGGIYVNVWDFYDFRECYVRDCYVRENYVVPEKLNAAEQKSSVNFVPKNYTPLT